MKHFNDQLTGILHENDVLKKKVEKQKIEYQTLSRKYESQQVLNKQMDQN